MEAGLKRVCFRFVILDNFIEFNHFNVYPEIFGAHKFFQHKGVLDHTKFTPDEEIDAAVAVEVSSKWLGLTV